MGRAPESPGIVGPYALVSGPPMSRRSLRPQLNQIRGWVRQGRTDAWIAHQLEVTVQQIQAFKREQGLEPDFEENGAAVEEVDLRAEDDAQIAAELEAEAAPQGRRRGARRRRGRAQGRRSGGRGRSCCRAAAEAEEDEKPKRAARRRGGRSRRRYRARRARSKARSTTAKRATACGWIPPSRTIRSTPSTGRVTARSRSRSRKTRS